jgi:alkylation response protein AidB-like acyl-CoA dehydrogenase
VHFTFTDEQAQFTDVVSDVLAALCPPDVVRQAWTAAPGELDRRLWGQLAALGVGAALVDESEGGLGLDECDLTLALERVGYHAAPGPLVESILIGPMFTEASDGSALVSTNLGGHLVAGAADADRLLLVDDSRSRLVAHSRDQVLLHPEHSVDRSRRLARVTPTAEGQLVSDDVDEIRRAYERGVFGVSAMLLGLAQRMLDMTAEYVTERHQFGVPIGSFQAVKHHCADALTALSFARPAVYRAGWSLATGAPDHARDVAMGKIVASDAARRIGRIALQCHGAIAYTVEYDLHLYLKRAEALAASWGGCASHRAEVARAISAA